MATEVISMVKIVRVMMNPVCVCSRLLFTMFARGVPRFRGKSKTGSSYFYNLSRNNELLRYVATLEPHSPVCRRNPIIANEMDDLLDDG